MAPTVPTGEPTTVIAGDSWIWTQTFPDYPSSEGWTLSYAFAGASKLDSQSSEIVASGGAWVITIPATRTLDLSPGAYQWAAYMTGSGAYAGRRHQVASGRLTVDADVATSTEGELQFAAEAQLAAIDAVIAGRITDDVQRVMIGARQVDKIPIGELFQLRGRLRREVWRAKHPTLAYPVIRGQFSAVR